MGRGLLWAGWIVTALVWPAGAAEYIDADAKITGKEVHAFQEQGGNVTVVLGAFEMTVGERIIRGRDAVLWIQTHDDGRIVRHDMTIYIEGDAQVIEPGGASTSDRTMLVTVHSQGRLTASGHFSQRSLAEFPLYHRAVKVRSGRRVAPPRPPATETIVRGASLPLVAQSSVQPVAVQASQPTTRATAPVVSPSDTGPPPTEASSTAEDTAKRQPPNPVNFHFEQVTFEQQPHRGVVIARGDVYLSQGDPDSDLFLELRSQAAVLFTQKGLPSEKETYSPFSPKLEGFGAEELTVTGVYLEGDVVISLGERYFRGPAAYYDFTTDRAIVTDPVFRTVQEQRDIPVYIRASQARVLSARELYFTDAKISTSDFYTPTYHIGARRVYLMDNTPYDAEGERLGEQAWHARMHHTTFNIRGLPILYTPFTQGDVEQGNSALRTAQIGKHGGFGWGVETKWHLFRLLGLLRPEGFRGRLNLDAMERGAFAGIDLSYAREKYSGYHILYGALDSDKEDDFGEDREDIPAPRERGRVLMRHKQFLPNDWQLQFELSYICDRNFLEEFFPDEFYAGKEQETLLYAKKQKDNWVFTSLAKVRLNRFQTQSESYPDLGFYLLGEPLLGDRLSFYHESHAGVKQYREAHTFFDEGHPNTPLDNFKSGHFVRLDTREELALPLHIGQLNIMPYVVGRATYWGREFPERLEEGGLVMLRNDESEHCRPYGQVGVKANTHFWRIYENAESRLWDVHRLKHIITPEVTGFLASSHGIYRGNLYPMDPDIEQHLERTSGFAVGLYQRLQTKRGPAGERRTVDWMRFNVILGMYDNREDSVPSDGRFFSSRPEYSLDRNHLNAEYAWCISDATTLLADANYDIDDQRLGRGNIGLSVVRDPRLRYYAGIRYIDDLESAVGTFGVNYKINRKYSISAFEQYDFAFGNGRNLSTSVTITRKFPRWFGAFTFSYDSSDNEATILLTFWPEGIPEVRIGGAKLSLLGQSDKN